MSVPEGFVDDPIFMPTLDALLACFAEALEEEQGPGLCYFGHMVGDIMPLALLGKECGGVGWLRPVEEFGSMVFPEPSEVVGITTPRAMVVEMGVARHYPTPTGRNAYVTPDVTRDTARIVQADRRAMLRAARCCFKGFDGSVSIGSWSPVPAEGTMVGGLINVTVRPGA